MNAVYALGKFLDDCRIYLINMRLSDDRMWFVDFIMHQIRFSMHFRNRQAENTHEDNE